MSLLSALLTVVLPIPPAPRRRVTGKGAASIAARHARVLGSVELVRVVGLLSEGVGP